MIMFTDADLIHSYSRADALADGVLIDISHPADDAGFTIPVAVTAAAWADSVAWDSATEAAKPCDTGQDEHGRLWDVVWMARLAIRRAAPAPRDRLDFDLFRVPATGRGLRPSRVTLVAVIGPGDDGSPVVTIMLPWED